MPKTTNNAILHVRSRKGFIAVAAVISLSVAALFSIHTTALSVMTFVDRVDRREWRLQARLNAESCLQVAAVMAAKDYFLDGDADVSTFGCVARIERDHIQRKAAIRARAYFSGVSSPEAVAQFDVP